MESPLVHSPLAASFTRSRSNTRLNDDLASLTSFNPFAEEDENDQSSYTLVTSLFSRVKNSLGPLSSAVNSQPGLSTSGPPNAATQGNQEARRPSYSTTNQGSSSLSRTSSTDKPFPLSTAASGPAPPLVSLTPVQSEAPTYLVDPYERSSSRGSLLPTPIYESPDGGLFGTAIPGFPIQDDARSIRTVGSLQRSESVSKVIRRIRGEGLSKDYWMDDSNAKECYDCKSEFSAWRRKHHCRICGQIFCSRCASNIISGSRFGHDGMIRVCNLCIDKLGKVDEDEDDDRRSVVSSGTSFLPHQLGERSGLLPQSPFAASQLFGHTAEPFNLYSIAETRRPRSGSDSSGYPSRAGSPQLRENEDGTWDESNIVEAVPFRRRASEDKSVVELQFDSHDSPTRSDIGPSDTQITFPRMNDTPMSTIQFPVSSPEHLDSPRSISRMRNRFDSFDHELPSPFIRSRVHSRIDSLTMGEPGWRQRRESTAYAQELNLISMQHLKVMLHQLLSSENIPNIQQWEETLLKMALRISKDLTFHGLPHRQGEDMDVRRYVKIKKLPGGTPADSEYVEGVVITKNVAHKQMSRFQRNARVMLVTFPLEFQRVEGQYMHFGQIFRQEREYLGNLATRIAALRPHIVLVEKSVSRLALDALAKYNVAVARAVKPSVIQTVARMTQADIFSDMGKLALEPHLGHCAKYRLQSFDHPLIPGRRKTYMRFEGCNRDLGCTIILRGENIEVLRRLKKVTRFLTFVVRNLKLETHLWKDSVITLPSIFPEPTSPSHTGPAVQSPPRERGTAANSDTVPTISVSSEGDENPRPIEIEDDSDLPDEDAERLRLSSAIQRSLKPYQETLISISSTLRFPPPYPIRRMKEIDDELSLAQRTWEDEVIRREEMSQSMIRSHENVKTPMPALTAKELAPANPLLEQPSESIHVDSDDIKAQIEALPLTNLAPLLTPEEPVPSNDGGYFGEQPTSSSVTNDVVASPLAIGAPPLKKASDIEVESHLESVKWLHEEQRRVWEWYFRKNNDDFAVEKYQCISVREFIIPMTESGLDKACFPPQIKYITFYGEGDYTLGQFLEGAVSDTLRKFLDPRAVCSGKGCDQPEARHCRVFVHNESRLFVAVEQWDGQIIGRGFVPAPELITTWSACRICGSATPFIPVSEEMQRYSFAKFLELHFYPADVKIVQGAGCQHNIYRHHVRYFATNGMTVRFQADPITLYEVVYPPKRIYIRPETKLELKNADYERLLHRSTLWYSALIDDLKLISIDAATGDEEADVRLLADIQTLIARAESEQEALVSFIHQIYRDSSAVDTLALNQVHAYRQDKIVAWQQDFDKLPKPKPIPAVDRNSRRVSSAFGSFRAMWPSKYEFGGSSMSEAEESPISTGRRTTGDSFNSSASDVASDASEAELGMSSDREPDRIPLSQQLPHVEIPVTIAEKEQSKEQDQDPDSDSTIGAAQEDCPPQSAVDALQKALNAEPPAIANVPQAEESSTDAPSKSAIRASKLPRRPVNHPTVADLVRKYQDYLPAQGMDELAKTAMSPAAPANLALVSESEQELPSPRIRRTSRNKGRFNPILKNSSTSDFESSYAANIAPKYLTHTRRPLPGRARIQGPNNKQESQESSRRTSPEKRSSLGQTSSHLPRPSSPNELAPASGSGKPKSRAASRNPVSKDKAANRNSDRPGRLTFRRPPGTPGGKVSNIAKHFERLGRDADRSMSRRYVVIRGRRARPVGSARAKVEVLDSVKDALDDSEEGSDLSEADDEGDDIEESNISTKRPPPEPALPESPVLQPSIELPAINVVASSPKRPPLELELDKARPVIPPLAPSEDAQPVNSETQVITTTAHPGPISLPPSPFFNSTFNKTGLPLTPPASDFEGGERSSILKTISALLLQHPSRAEFDDPMNDPEHIFRDSSMIVRTDEPTSIIALALNSPQYRELLTNSRADKRSRGADLTESGEAFMPDDRSIAESTSTWGVVNVDAGDTADPTEDLRVPSSKLPWVISFESGGLTISCTLLYPEQFDALRRTYDCEKKIIESLARCAKWNVNGGKSGSAFLKTLDDRFIAKELSRPELQAMETFAPAYFDYMSSAVNANRPVLLAKVLGCYKLTFKKTAKAKDKNNAKSKSTQMNLLVMENLFYDRRFSKIYDLKGSTRNRHVQSTGRENEVLLDENYIQTAHLSPFYLREHSKRIIRGALHNDTKFLASINVMDYSLVIGVDSQKNELVAGIVDYIRTYTWDKKLENLVKESTFLGTAAKGEPTIITPKLYRHRFLTSMERYFPLVPDRWMKHKDCPDVEMDAPPDW